MTKLNVGAIYKIGLLEVRKLLTDLTDEIKELEAQVNQ